MGHRDLTCGRSPSRSEQILQWGVMESTHTTRPSGDTWDPHLHGYCQDGLTQATRSLQPRQEAHTGLSLTNLRARSQILKHRPQHVL